MRLRCANCRKAFQADERQTVSRVYGTHGSCSLCDSCLESENKAIDSKQSNDVPELRVLYLGERRKTERSTTGSVVTH